MDIPFEVSDKLSRYIAKIEANTKREVKAELVYNVDPSGATAAFLPDSTHITICLARSLCDKPEEAEHNIAHEATHGLLVYEKHYCAPMFFPFVFERFAERAKLIITTVEDIVVFKILSQEGFVPFSPVYLDEVRKETSVASKHTNYYQRYSHDPIYKNLYIIHRYIIAWGLSKYCDIDATTNAILNAFLLSIESAYPKHFAMIKRIKEIVEKNDIFTAEGCCKAIDAMLSIWNLSRFVKLGNPVSV